MLCSITAGVYSCGAINVHKSEWLYETVNVVAGTRRYYNRICTKDADISMNAVSQHFCMFTTRGSCSESITHHVYRILSRAVARGCATSNLVLRSSRQLQTHHIICVRLPSGRFLLNRV